MIEISKNKTVLGSEFPYCNTIQLIMIILFFLVWALDSFICNYSSFLVGFFPLPLRLFLAIVSLGLGVYLVAKSHNAVFAETHDLPKLIEVGVYSWVRHPIYLGTLIFCLGFFVYSFSLLSLGVWIGFFVLYHKMVTYEEKDLIRISGEQYVAYQKRVPKWVPRIRFVAV